MKLRIAWKNGAILLQTLIMSVMLSMIAVMLIKWVLARLIIANRMQNSAKNTGIALGYNMKNIQTWSAFPPAATDNTKLVFEKNVSFTPLGGGKFVTTVDDDF